MEVALIEKGALRHLSFAESLPDLRASAAPPPKNPGCPLRAIWGVQGHERTGTCVLVTSSDLSLRTGPAQTHRGNPRGPEILLRAPPPPPP